MTPANGLKAHKLIILRVLQYPHMAVHMLNTMCEQSASTVASTTVPLIITLPPSQKTAHSQAVDDSQKKLALY
jgi:hypothetical protein